MPGVEQNKKERLKGEKYENFRKINNAKRRRNPA